MFREELAQLKRLGIRHSLTQALNFALVLSTALMMWKGLAVVCNTESPVVVVLTESMEPAIQRGDLLFLTMPRSTPLRDGDITVYKVPGAPIPIVHRVIEAHNEPDGADQWILTKGDNNPVDDVGLYRGLKYLKRSHITGKVQAYVPYVGYGTILLNDYPKLKYALLAGSSPPPFSLPFVR
ncbi:putative Signal peptidase I, partial [Rhodotorula taiwanensis]